MARSEKERAHALGEARASPDKTYSEYERSEEYQEVVLPELRRLAGYESGDSGMYRIPGDTDKAERLTRWFKAGWHGEDSPE